MEPSRALLGCLASAAAAAPPGEDGAGAGAEEEEEEEEEAAAAAPGELGSDAPLPYWTAVFEYEAAGEDELTLRLGVQRALGLTRAATAQPGPQLGGLLGCGDRRLGWHPPCAHFPLGCLFSLSNQGLASTYCPRCWG